MLRHLRKILLILGKTSLYIINKNSPTILLELIYFLNTPLPTPFFNPISQKKINDIAEKRNFFYLGLLFIKSYSYTKQKKKKFRFLKRKIKRRMVLKNMLVD